MKSRHHLRVALIFAIVIVVADQLSKQWALGALDQGRIISVIGDFITFKLTFNSGAAFSFLDGHTWVFTVVSTIVVVGLPIVIRRSPRTIVLYSLAAIWGGALGNLLDRIMRDPGFPNGHVVDFINYNGWFIGNVADIALVVGVFLLVVAELVQPHGEFIATEPARATLSDQTKSDDDGSDDSKGDDVDQERNGGKS